MRHHHVLSQAGSDRATAYNMSNKIIRCGDSLYVGWLDAPPQPGQPARIMLGFCDAASGALQKTFQLGEGFDNHCGPALGLDNDGRLYSITGAHHGPFWCRWSDAPEDEKSWSSPEPLGPADTYPSLAVGSDGSLHLAHRERGERWQLWYRRKRPDRGWEIPQPVAVSPTSGYNHFMQSLTVGPTGVLHLTFQFHFAESGRAEDCIGRAAVHLLSEDGGETWLADDGSRASLPITLESMRPVCHYPRGGVRVGNHVVDAKDQVWLFGTVPGAPAGVLWRRGQEGWQPIDLTGSCPGLNTEGGRATSLSRDPSGHLHLVMATRPDGQTARWFDLGHELFYLVFDADGQLLSSRQLTQASLAAARWLPALELWDWNRRGTGCSGGLWLAYTSGLNAGGIGGDNRNDVKTEVHLALLNDWHPP